MADVDDGGKATNVEELLNNPEVQKAIQAKLDAEVAGLKSKNSELLDKFKKVSEQVKAFDGLDIDKIKTLQKQMEENEEMRLLAEGKTEEVVNRRIENMKRDFDAQLAAREQKLTEFQSVLKTKDEKLAELVIDGQIREAYVGLDFEPAAMEDTLMVGRKTFIMDENGKAVPRDSHGNLIFGKDGKTPITAKEWLENLSETKKYLRRQSIGAGAQGGGRSTRDVDTSKMTSTQRIAHALRNGALR